MCDTCLGIEGGLKPMALAWKRNPSALRGNEEADGFEGWFLFSFHFRGLLGQDLSYLELPWGVEQEVCLSCVHR